MIRRRRNVRIYVRNKMRYNPAAKVYDFLHVDVANFAGTTIGDVKEEVKRKCGNSLKIDDLYLNNQALADDRSIAHYNIEDGTILETTSNPFWVTCLSIKQIEVEREQAQNPNDKNIQNWTNRSLLRKKTLLSVLLNSKKEYRHQPPHFPELEDLVIYLERLGKKGAQMNPNYTQKDLQLMFEDYVTHDLGSDDPIGAFIHRNAVRLGLRQPGKNQFDNRGTDLYGDVAQNDQRKHTEPRAGTSGQRNTPRAPRARLKERWCEDCETNRAELYCAECQNAQGGQGLALCRQCSAALHIGATRRRHDVKDVTHAPKVTQSYVPHAYKAPFALLVGMYSGLTDRPPKLSMTEDEIKLRAQPLTDTDLQDKQNGRYVGGFECMENSLILKGLVQREASANPTYALTDTGQELAEILFTFQQTVQRYMRSHDQPQNPNQISTSCGTRKICLIIDEQERDRERLLEIAASNNIDAQVRRLPAGDYIWILTPPLPGHHVKYTQCQPALETVLPFIVERKSWEDLEDSIRTKRFHKQVNNMLESGLICFYLMEGYVQNLRYRPTEQHQKNLKGALEKLLIDQVFFLSYTASWFKSAKWLMWFTELVTEAHTAGIYKDRNISYSTYMSRTNGQRVDNVLQRSDFRPSQTNVWSSHQFIDVIFSDWYKEKSLLDTIEEGRNKNNKSILFIQNLETYNKKRQSVMNKCLNAVHENPNNVDDTVKKSFVNKHKMLHYDVMCYLQLKIQVMAEVYVLRTESEAETQRIQTEIQQGILEGQRIQPENQRINRGQRLPNEDQRTPKRSPKKRKQDDNSNKKQTKSQNENISKGDFASDPQTEEFMIQQALALSTATAIEKDDVGQKKARNVKIVSPRRTRSSKTDSQSAADEMIGHTAEKQVIQSRKKKVETVTSSNIRAKSPELQIPGDETEEEILQRILRQSLEEAERQKLQQNNLGSNVDDIDGTNSIDDNIDDNVGLEQINRVTTPDEELKISLEQSKIDSGQKQHMSDSQDEELQFILQQSKMETTTVSGSNELVDSQDDEIRLAIEKSKMDTGIIHVSCVNTVQLSDSQVDELDLVIEQSKMDTNMPANFRDQNIDLQNSISRDRMDSQTKYDSTSANLTDSQDENLQMVLRLSKEEYEKNLEKSQSGSNQQSVMHQRSDLRERSKDEGFEIRDVNKSTGKKNSESRLKGAVSREIIEILDSQESEIGEKPEVPVGREQQIALNADICRNKCLVDKGVNSNDVVLVDSQDIDNDELDSNVDTGSVYVQHLEEGNRTPLKDDHHIHVPDKSTHLAVNNFINFDMSLSNIDKNSQEVTRAIVNNVLAGLESPQPESLRSVVSSKTNDKSENIMDFDDSEQFQSVSILDPMNYNITSDFMEEQSQQLDDSSVSQCNSVSGDIDERDREGIKKCEASFLEKSKIKANKLVDSLNETENSEKIFPLPRGKVLVENTQDIDSMRDEEFTNSAAPSNCETKEVSDFIAETQRVNKINGQHSWSKVGKHFWDGNEQSENDDINVIPPSPEKDNSFTSRHNRSIGYLTSHDRSHDASPVKSPHNTSVDCSTSHDMSHDQSNDRSLYKSSHDQLHNSSLNQSQGTSLKSPHNRSVDCSTSHDMSHDQLHNSSPNQSQGTSLKSPHNTSVDCSTSHNMSHDQSSGRSLYKSSHDQSHNSSSNHSHTSPLRSPHYQSHYCSSLIPSHEHPHNASLETLPLNCEFGNEESRFLNEKGTDGSENIFDTCPVEKLENRKVLFEGDIWAIKSSENGESSCCNTTKDISLNDKRIVSNNDDSFQKIDKTSPVFMSQKRPKSLIISPVKSLFQEDDFDTQKLLLPPLYTDDDENCVQSNAYENSEDSSISLNFDYNNNDSCDLPSPEPKTSVESSLIKFRNEQVVSSPVTTSDSSISSVSSSIISTSSVNCFENERISKRSDGHHLGLDLPICKIKSEPGLAEISELESTSIPSNSEKGSSSVMYDSSKVIKQEKVDSEIGFNQTQNGNSSQAGACPKIKSEYDRNEKGNHYQIDMGICEAKKNSEAVNPVGDAELARRLQEEFDKEYERLKSNESNNKRNTRQTVQDLSQMERNDQNPRRKINPDQVEPNSGETVIVANSSLDISVDEEIARQLQNEISKEENMLQEVRDSELAKRLQADLGSGLITVDKSVEMMDSEYAKHLQDSLVSEQINVKDDIELIDAEYAKQLQENLSREVIQNKNLETSDFEFAKMLQESPNDSVMTQKIDGEFGTQDSQLFDRFHGNGSIHTDMPRSPHKRKGDNSTTTPSPAKSRKRFQALDDSIPSSIEALWNRKPMSVQKKEKIKSTSQLEQIRREKHERFQNMKPPSGTPYRTPTSTVSRPPTSSQISGGHTRPSSSPYMKNNIPADSRNFINLDDDDDDNDVIEYSPPSSPLESVPFHSNIHTPTASSQHRSNSSSSTSWTSSSSSNMPNSNWTPSSGNKPSSSWTPSSGNKPSSSWTPSSDNKPSSSWTPSSGSKPSSSWTPSSDNKPSSTWSSQSSSKPDMFDENFSSTQSSSPLVQSESRSNVTCSVCGEKGHTRVWKKCPRYFSMEEMAHRQSKEEKRRKEIEEKERSEQRARDELRHHELALDAIIAQIQQEKTGLGQTIKQLDKKKKQRDKKKKD